jgi:hypothetical protein
MSNLRFLQIKLGCGDPFAAVMPRLDYVMKGIKRVRATSGKGVRERLPITPDILLRLKGVWVQTAHDPDTKLICAACCLCFFAFLRVGEMTTRTQRRMILLFICTTRTSRWITPETQPS